MEHIKKYLFLYILAAAGIAFAIWYFVIRKKQPAIQSEDSIKKLAGPSIYDAKQSLQEKIINNDYVSSIGTRQIDSKSFIQVTVKSESSKSNIKALLDENGKWQGFPVDITVAEPIVPQINKKETYRQKWAFKTVIPTIKDNQKRLAVNLKSGDQPIPLQFKAGRNIKLKIQQTPDYTYDITGKIIEIDPNRDSMLTEFIGKVTSKASGEVELL